MLTQAFLNDIASLNLIYEVILQFFAHVRTRKLTINWFNTCCVMANPMTGSPSRMSHVTIAEFPSSAWMVTLSGADKLSEDDKNKRHEGIKGADVTYRKTSCTYSPILMIKNIKTVENVLECALHALST